MSKNLSLAPAIHCPRCKSTVFPWTDDGMYRAVCQKCCWTYVAKEHAVGPLELTAPARFNQLCDEIERQGKSGQLLEILRTNFADFLSYVESEEMKRCDALAIGVNTLATLAVLKHI